METCLVYVTTPTREGARRLARIAVENRLAACANILPHIESIYIWQGSTCDDTEALLLMKTTRDRFDALRDAVAAEHPYDCPCIVALPIAAGHPPFLDWIHAQTEKK